MVLVHLRNTRSRCLHAGRTQCSGIRNGGQVTGSRACSPITSPVLALRRPTLGSGSSLDAGNVCSTCAVHRVSGCSLHALQHGPCCMPLHWADLWMKLRRPQGTAVSACGLSGQMLEAALQVPRLSLLGRSVMVHSCQSRQAYFDLALLCQATAVNDARCMAMQPGHSTQPCISSSQQPARHDTRHSQRLLDPDFWTYPNSTLSIGPAYPGCSWTVYVREDVEALRLLLDRACATSSG